MKPSTRFVTMAIGFELSLAAIALLIGPWLSCDITGELGRPFPHLTDINPAASITKAAGFVLQMTLATLPMVAGLAMIIRSDRAPFAHLKQVVNERLVPLLRPLSTWELCLIGCAAGFGEEVLFRGLMQTALGGYFPEAPSLPIGTVAVVFGLLHLVTPTYGVLATIAGAYLGWLYYWTDNLWMPIGVHTAYDVVALCWIVRSPRTKKRP